MKIQVNKRTGFFRAIGEYGITQAFETRESAKTGYQRLRRNGLARMRRECLKDLGVVEWRDRLGSYYE